eukprot:GILK01004229.1.p1 GENE.GILK01004229.1~~GILK01004229.1.p1  ORF type:complete len:355 (+),score=47.72 GILK01004229.1:57-1121(+)
MASSLSRSSDSLSPAALGAHTLTANVIISDEDVPALPPWLRAMMPFRRRIAKINNRRIHFIDEGPADGTPIFLVHGNPTWCFIWRKVIAQLVKHNEKSQKKFRIIAPDMLGFGLSDKPSDVNNPYFHPTNQANILYLLVEALNLHNVTIVGQDWGGPISAGMANRSDKRVRAAVFANTAVLAPKRPLSPTTFHRMSQLPYISDVLFRGLRFPLFVLHKVQGNRASIGRVERQAYLFPFSSWDSRASILALARAVPASDDAAKSLALLDETEQWAANFQGPVALVWGMKDPILGRAFPRMKEAFPNVVKTVETRAGHFLQEEVPDVLVEAIIAVNSDKTDASTLSPVAVSMQSKL